MNAKVIKRYKHAFEYGLNGGKIWIRYVKEFTWELRKFYELSFDNPSTYYIADDKNAEFAKAIVDGKTVEVYSNGEWRQSIYNNNIEDMLEKGLNNNCIYTIIKERWKPKLTKVYYFVNDRGLINSDNWLGLEIDKQRYEVGNVFQTKEQAADIADKIKQILRDEKGI